MDTSFERAQTLAALRAELPGLEGSAALDPEIPGPPLAAAGSGDAPEAMDDPPNEASWPPRGTGGRGRDPLFDARGFNGRGGTRRRTEKGFFSPRK